MTYEEKLNVEAKRLDGARYDLTQQDLKDHIVRCEYLAAADNETARLLRLAVVEAEEMACAYNRMKARAERALLEQYGERPAIVAGSFVIDEGMIRHDSANAVLRHKIEHAGDMAECGDPVCQFETANGIWIDFEPVADHYSGALEHMRQYISNGFKTHDAEHAGPIGDCENTLCRHVVVLAEMEEFFSNLVRGPEADE